MPQKWEAFDTLEVLDESSRIKGQRIAHRVQFLLEIDCSDLSNNSQRMC